MTQAAPPPFPVDAQVRYVGAYTFTREGEGPVSPGMVGVVVATEAGMPAHPEVFGPDDQPIDGWSVVLFPGGGRVAVSEGDEHYVLVAEHSSSARGKAPRIGRSDRSRRPAGG